MNKRPHVKRTSIKLDKIELPTRLAGLAKTHRIIRIQKQKEIQFMNLCAQIRFDDFKQNRSDNQRNDRRNKRHKTVVD